jgi:hypothetical protein
MDGQKYLAKNNEIFARKKKTSELPLLEMSVLHSVLHIHPCCLSMLHTHSVCPCCMLHEHVA